MAVSFIGHTPNFAVWVFNIDGKRFVARNLSTPEPLNIKFAGAYDDSPLAAPLIKTSGFDITESSPRIVVWTWNGRLYTSSWDVNDEDIEDVVLYFSSPIPYSGPPVAPVGTGVTNTQSPPPAAIPAIVPSLPIDGSNATAVDETKEALVAANKALAASEAQGRVNVQALNTARVELQNAKDALSAAQARATADQAAMMARLQEQLEGIEERTQIQINVYRQAMEQAQRTPPATTPPVTAPMPSPVVAPPTTPSVSPAGTDWVKLGLQLGAAYLLLS
jgi:hypothetical protein